MEVGRHIYKILRAVTLMMCMLMASPLHAQPTVKKYVISQGGMKIMLGKKLSDASLQEFIDQYDLAELALPQYLKSNFKDSIIKHGWRIDSSSHETVVLSKPFGAVNNVGDPAELIRMAGLGIYFNPIATPALMGDKIGINIFRNDLPFNIKDSIATFVLRRNPNAGKVMLAGNFTNWADGALPMKKTDSGWSMQVKLLPGKYLYKFIVDGNWITDPDNSTTENDGEGNTNSVWYFTNILFKLDGYTTSKKVYVAGSFSNWQSDRLRMKKTATGWELPACLDTGTYTYRYMINNKWIADPLNPDRFPNEFGEYNSVIRIGKPIIFQITGLQDAKNVFLAGSFNDFRSFELRMTKTPTGWQIPYVLGAGNYEYKFIVDGTWIDSRGNELARNEPGDIFVLDPNYTFRLKNQGKAKTVFVSGDFNSWSPNAYKLTRDGDDWVLKLHLSKGKHLYKYVIDGNWTKDPGNEYWEQNEFGTGNSVLWVE